MENTEMAQVKWYNKVNWLTTLRVFGSVAHIIGVGASAAAFLVGSPHLLLVGLPLLVLGGAAMDLYISLHE